MSRRIQTAPRAEDEPLLLGPAIAKKSDSQGDSYIDRLLKYIPAEVIALYLGATNVVPYGAKNEKAALWIIAGLTAVCTPIYMWFATREPGKPTVWAQIIISSVAFPIWVFAIGGPFAITFPNWYPENKWIAAIVISFATFLLGMYQPTEPTSDKPARKTLAPAAKAESAAQADSSVPLF